MSRTTVRALVDDYRTADLEPADLAVMEFADKIAHDATSVTQADVDHLRALGLADGDILDVVLAATVRCFFSKTLDALGVEPDAKYSELDPDLQRHAYRRPPDRRCADRGTTSTRP